MQSSLFWELPQQMIHPQHRDFSRWSSRNTSLETKKGKLLPAGLRCFFNTKAQKWKEKQRKTNPPPPFVINKLTHFLTFLLWIIHRAVCTEEVIPVTIIDCECCEWSTGSGTSFLEREVTAEFLNVVFHHTWNFIHSRCYQMMAEIMVCFYMCMLYICF